MVEGRVEGGGGGRGGGGTYEVHASPPRLKEVQDALGMGYKDAREVNARGGGRQSETDSVACKAGAKTTTAAQQRCSGMHTPLAPEYRVLPLPAPPPPAHCHPDQGWWSHARCGRRPRRRGEGAVDWGPCMQATLTCSTGGCCPNPRFACVPLNPAPITMTSWWERKQGVCVGVWRGRHGVGACGQDRPTSVSTQPHNTAWRPQPTPGSMRAGRVQGTCLRVWGHTLKQ